MYYESICTQYGMAIYNQCIDENDNTTMLNY